MTYRTRFCRSGLLAFSSPTTPIKNGLFEGVKLARIGCHTCHRLKNFTVTELFVVVKGNKCVCHSVTPKNAFFIKKRDTIKHTPYLTSLLLLFFLNKKKDCDSCDKWRKSLCGKA